MPLRELGVDAEYESTLAASAVDFPPRSAVPGESPAGHRYRVTPHGTRTLGPGDRHRQALDDHLWDCDHKPDANDP